MEQCLFSFAALLYLLLYTCLAEDSIPVSKKKILVCQGILVVSNYLETKKKEKLFPVVAITGNKFKTIFPYSLIVHPLPSSSVNKSFVENRSSSIRLLSNGVALNFSEAKENMPLGAHNFPTFH